MKLNKVLLTMTVAVLCACSSVRPQAQSVHQMTPLDADLASTSKYILEGLQTSECILEGPQTSECILEGPQTFANYCKGKIQAINLSDRNYSYQWIRTILLQSAERNQSIGLPSRITLDTIMSKQDSVWRQGFIEGYSFSIAGHTSLMLFPFFEQDKTEDGRLYADGWKTGCGCASHDIGLLINLRTTKYSLSDKSRKGKSVATAMNIIAKHTDRKVFAEISQLDDIDALRIIAVATQAAAWPMEVGENLDVDNKLNDMSLTAIKRLHRIGTDEARESLDYAKQIFVIDGATGTFFKELEFGPITDEIVEEQMRHVNKTEPSVLP